MTQLPAFRRARDIALYVSNDGEIDVAPLAAIALARRKRVWLPVVRPGGRMEFARSRPGGPMRRNVFGIAEPASLRRERRGAARLDLLVVPLVAFDHAGRRLGMGGGFYDRALAGTRRPYLAGVAFALQEVTRLPARAWDIPMHMIVTERGIVRPAPRGEGDLK
jgi:5-formyltetrahydrofolate cyclo-ligase